MPEDPDYKVYRSRPRLSKGRDDRVREGLQELRDAAPDAPRQPGSRPEYTPQRRRVLPRLRMRRPSGRISAGRVVKWIVTAIVAWLLLSLVLFMVSAYIERQNTSDAARSALSGTGWTLTSAQTILVLGSDARSKGYAEPGAAIGGPSRSDSIMLIRTGGGKAAKLSIPRDTVVNIPGHGLDKINAAYAIGGASLTIKTIEAYLGIKINHIVEVNFANFPEFIDSLGGIDIRTKCIHSDINGGKKNGGFSLRLKPGVHHLDGRDALTLARTRKNSCRPQETDLDRARRQQQVLASIKSKLISPSTFFRLPWVAWNAPKAIKTDMGGPSLLGLFGAIEIGGNPKTDVLGSIQPDGGVGSTDAQRRAAVRRFLKG